MISSEKNQKMNSDKFEKFGEVMQDGRLTASSDIKKYRLRDAILLSNQLGRPLSQEEMNQFEI